MKTNFIANAIKRVLFVTLFFVGIVGAVNAETNEAEGITRQYSLKGGLGGNNTSSTSTRDEPAEPFLIVTYYEDYNFIESVFLDDFGFVTVTITNSNGATVYQTLVNTMSTRTLTTSVSNLASGDYRISYYDGVDQAYADFTLD